MLDISDMSEKDRLFFFMHGLQRWAAQELHRRGVEDLPTALATAEKWMDFSKKVEPSGKSLPPVKVKVGKKR